MAEEWFYVINGERRGPAALPELVRLVREGRLTQADLVWHPDFGRRWKPARDVCQLMIAFSAADIRPAVAAATPDGVPLTPVERGPSVGSDLEPSPEAVPLWGKRGSSPSAWRSAFAAWRWMKLVLFKPFSFSLWCGIAFCAWLASLQTGNPLGNLLNSFARDGVKGGEVDVEKLQRIFAGKISRFTQFVQTPTGQMVVLSSLVLFVLFALVSFYFRGRGLLMFQHRLYAPRASIGEAWRSSKKGAFSLFRWFLGYEILFYLFLGGLAYGAWNYFGADLYLNQWQLREEHIMPIMITGSVAATVGLTFALSMRITTGWIVPMMYCRGVTASAAWRSAWSLMCRHPFRVVGYFLVQDLYTVFFWTVYVFLILGTCCVAMLPLMVPFVQTIFLLPALFFNRGYSTIYFSQWRPDLVTPVNPKTAVEFSHKENLTRRR